MFGKGSYFMLKVCSFGLRGLQATLGQSNPQLQAHEQIPETQVVGGPCPLGTHSSPHHLSMSFPCSPAGPFPSHPQLVSRMGCLVQGEERIVAPLSYGRTDL